jgi:hypothetical protein
MDFIIEQQRFEKMVAKEGELEIGVGVGLGRSLFRPVYDGCRCACHRLPMMHIAACNRQSKLTHDTPAPKSNGGGLEPTYLTGGGQLCALIPAIRRAVGQARKAPIYGLRVSRDRHETFFDSIGQGADYDKAEESSRCHAGDRP